MIHPDGSYTYPHQDTIDCRCPDCQRRLATLPPTIASHPYKVGGMVYPTLVEASQAATRAVIAYPSAVVNVVDRRTDTILATVGGEPAAADEFAAADERMVRRAR